MTKNKTAVNRLIIAGLTLWGAHLNAELEPLTVLAKRIPSSKADTTSAITILTAEELKRIQESRLINGLDLAPGVQGLSTAGQTGNLGTVLIRGLSTKYMQVVVDGVRLTDSTNGVSNFLGNAQFSGITNLEILRGPQSVLYGSGAAGGVVGYETALGAGDGESTSISAEAGNFGTFRSSFLTQGKIGNVSYAVGAGDFETENDPQGDLFRHDYRQNFETLALQWQAREDLQVTLSYRGSQNKLETLTSGFFSARYDVDVDLLALNLEYEASANWLSKLTLGYYDEVSNGSFESPLFNASTYNTDYERASLNWLNTFSVNDQFEVQAGAEYARSDYRNPTVQEIDYGIFGVFVNGVWKPRADLLFEGGIRYEDHSEFGGDFAWNLGTAYHLGDSDTRFRARVAEAYRTPTLIDSQMFNPGFGTIQDANQDLEAEQVFGFELGLEHEFDSHLLELGYFQQHLVNAIARGPVSGGSYQNMNLAGSTKVSGLEFALSGRLPDQVRYRIAATRQFKEELIDVPDFQVSTDFSYEHDRWSGGVGMTYNDGASYGLAGATDSRVLARIYGSYELNEAITLYGRVENLFDSEYLLSDDGFLPITGQGRSFVLGATLQW